MIGGNSAAGPWTAGAQGTPFDIRGKSDTVDWMESRADHLALRGYRRASARRLGSRDAAAAQLQEPGQGSSVCRVEAGRIWMGRWWH